MIKNIFTNDGFSLLEVLMASLIFILSVASILVTLNAVRVPVLNKENELASVVYGKQVLEALYSDVNAQAGGSYYHCSGFSGSSCTDFSLYLGPHAVPPATLLPLNLSIPGALTGCNANLSYTVFCADGTAPSGANPNLTCTNPTVGRGVNLGILWPDVATGAC